MNHRRGQGAILSLALLFVLVLAIMQYAQTFLLAQVHDQTAREALGREVALVAESAVGEAQLIVATRLRTPGDPLYDVVRAAGERAPYRFSLAPSALTRTARLLQTPTGRNAALAGAVECVLTPTGATVAGLEGGEGVIAYAARAVSVVDPAVVRSVEASQAFKVDAAVPPPALTGAAVLVFHGRRLVSEPLDANALVGLIPGDYVAPVRARYVEIQKKFETSRAKDDPFLQSIRPYYEQLGRDPRREGKNHFDAIDELARRYRPYPGTPFALASVPAEVDLEQLDLQGALTAHEAKLRRALDDIARAGAEVKRLESRTDDAARAAHQAHGDAMLAALVEVEAMLEDLLAFQQAMAVVDGPAHAALKEAYRAVDPALLAERVNAFSFRAHVEIDEEAAGPQHVPVDAQWKRLLARTDGAATGLEGTVFVSTPGEPLALSGAQPGTRLIAVAGDVLLDGVHPRAAGQLVAVVAGGYGPDHRVKVAGEVAAVLSARGATLDCAEGTALTGALVLDEIAPRAPGAFRGKAKRDPRLAAPGDAARLIAGLSPWTRSIVHARR